MMGISPRSFVPFPILFVAIAFAIAPLGANAADPATKDKFLERIRQQQEQIDALKAVVDKILPISHQSDVFHVDNDTEPTLVNFTAAVAVDNGLTVGAQIEAQIASNPSNAVSQDTENASTGSINFTERHLEIFFDSKRDGKLSLGQGNTASEGSSEIDLSGTNIVTRSNFGTLGGGLLFRNSTTNALTTTTVGGAFDNFDGLSRDDRIRYDTPNFAGFLLSASAIQGGATDLALRYSADFGGMKFAAGVAVANRSSTPTTIERQWNRSGSVLWRNGLNLTVAAGARELKSSASNDPVFLYGKLGYRQSWLGLGKTSLSIEWARHDDLAANGDEAVLYGIGASQRIDEWGIDLYAGFRIYDLDRNGASLDDLSVAMIGTYFTF